MVIIIWFLICKRASLTSQSFCSVVLFSRSLSWPSTQLLHILAILEETIKKSDCDTLRSLFSKRWLYKPIGSFIVLENLETWKLTMPTTFLGCWLRFVTLFGEHSIKAWRSRTHTTIRNDDESLPFDFSEFLPGKSLVVRLMSSW